VRLFFSLPLPGPVRDALRPPIDAARAVGRGVSFGKIEQLHFTLAFLGEQPEARLGAAMAAAEEAVRGLEGFDLAIGGAGAFPSTGRPRVLWLGVPRGGSQLVDVAHRLSSELRQRGFDLEDRPFRAHLTIGRVRPGGDREARSALTALRSGELASFRVDGIRLVQSVLGAGGATHTELRSFPLVLSS
jgi:2'-5' RNA ligase